MKIPQLLVIAILAMSLGINLGEASKEDGKASKFISQIIVTAVWIGLLTWGGFWK